MFNSDPEKIAESAEPDFDVNALPMHLQLLYAQLKVSLFFDTLSVSDFSIRSV
jgi:hypothetical protein